jgi:hypothetical protein
MRKGILVVLPIGLSILCGCASEQLNYNTLDLASSSDDLMTSQVLSNLSKFRSYPYAIPAQVSITAGSATTTNSITPTATAPLGASATTTLANTVAAPFFNAATRTHVTGAGSIGVTAADQYSQNWSLAPLEDPDQPRRLRALYRFGAQLTGEPELLCEYPLVQKAQGSGASSAQQTVTLIFPGSTAQANSTKDEKPVTKYTLRDCPKIDLGTPDPEFLKPPGCVICDYQGDKGEPQATFSGKTTQKQATFTGTTKKDDNIITKIGRISGDTKSLQVGDWITGPCIPKLSKKLPNAPTTITKIASDVTISNPATCDNASGTFAAKPPPETTFSGKTETDKYGTTIDTITIVSGNPTLQSGESITGLCIPTSTIIKSIDAKITLSNSAQCDGLGTFKATPPPPPPPPHKLEVNKSLSNQWAIFGDELPQEGATTLGQEFAKPLGNGTYNIYLRPGYRYSKEYSDFVLFVLEATMQSTSAAGAAAKPTTAHLPAGAAVELTP